MCIVNKFWAVDVIRLHRYDHTGLWHKGIAQGMVQGYLEAAAELAAVLESKILCWILENLIGWACRQRRLILSVFWRWWTCQVWGSCSLTWAGALPSWNADDVEACSRNDCIQKNLKYFCNLNHVIRIILNTVQYWAEIQSQSDISQQQIYQIGLAGQAADSKIYLSHRIWKIHQTKSCFFSNC